MVVTVLERAAGSGKGLVQDGRQDHDLGEQIVQLGTELWAGGHFSRYQRALNQP